ncbi:(2Fe-2S)-binding protein [Pontixanthobacter sp. CEM42]|uniref:(2Fe-2S)-binding protein n=1 Tax=Pontixanthobacter sp. CEM42 TaxID=2792077 RepID=UPI001ADF009C|nr:(2Fe-2S)-binding protein [Pontixanthobacter sp. CEM42]
MVKISVNGKAEDIDVDPAMPLLWAVREQLGMTGTKFGCGIAQCGACTMHLDGEPIRSCSTPISAAEGKEITTIEGIADPDGTLSKVQQAWISEQVPQCGYCQSGQIMSATALLRQTPRPTDEQINAYMSGNVCRCGMYGRIRKAIKVAAGLETATGADIAEEASA